MRYEPNGIMMLTNELFAAYGRMKGLARKITSDIMPQKINYGAPKTPEDKAKEIEAIKSEVAKVGIPEVMAKIDAIITVINDLAGKQNTIIGRQNAIIENLETAWKRIMLLEAFAFTEPSIKSRIDAIEMKVFGGIAEMPVAEEKAEDNHEADAVQESKEKIDHSADKIEPETEAPLMAADIEPMHPKKKK